MFIHSHLNHCHPNIDSGPFYKISTKKKMKREQEKQHKLKPDAVRQQREIKACYNEENKRKLRESKGKVRE